MVATRRTRLVASLMVNKESMQARRTSISTSKEERSTRKSTRTQSNTATKQSDVDDQFKNNTAHHEEATVATTETASSKQNQLKTSETTVEKRLSLAKTSRWTQKLGNDDTDAAPAAKPVANEKNATKDRESIATKTIATIPTKRDKSTNENNAEENELTKLIPGYVAPLKLDTSSLDPYRPSGGLTELCRQAERTDASTAGFVVDATEPHVQAMKKTPNGFLPSTYTSRYSSFKQGTKRVPDTSAGKGWFGMQPTPMTDELKTDLAVIRNRNYLDPKRFYKSADKNTSGVLQVGTVIEGSAEFYSSRLTKKQRRSNLAEEIMADPAAADYTRTKYKVMQQSKTANERKRYKKKLSKNQRRGY